MSYLKTLTSKDLIVTPFTVHKTFSYTGNPPSYNNGDIVTLTGTQSPYPEAGGKIGTGSAALLYNSVKHLYYSNYISGSNGEVSNASTASFNPDGTVTGPFYTPNYINNIQSSEELRIWDNPSYVTILSIPSKKYGDFIKPKSYRDSTYYDDGEGNIRLTSDGTWKGNIIYSEGLIIILGLVLVSNPQWDSSYTLYETQYKCTIRANEYNYSLNPSLLSGSIIGQNNILNSGSATYEDFVTGSDFSPFITTIGLYDNKQNLLAVAKLAQPLLTSQTTDTTILVNLDR